MVEFDTNVIDVIQRTHNVKSFRFKAERAVDFKAGQFFFLTIKIGREEKSKHFSFSNSPTEKEYLEFTKRITDSQFSQALDKLKIGDWARIKMPYGAFVCGGDCERIAFLSGGIGITPIRSMCKFLTDKKSPVEVTLLYGNNKEEDIIFRQDLEDMQKINKNIHVVYTLTSPDADVDKEKWPGRVGCIDDKMIKEEIPDYKSRTFYICGPPRMVESLVGLLKKNLAVGEDKIRIENFSGY